MIWAASLLHSGSPILDSNRTRLSQVSHYFFDQGANTTYWIPSVSRGTWIAPKGSFGSIIKRRKFRVARQLPPGYSKVPLESIRAMRMYLANRTEYFEKPAVWRWNCEVCERCSTGTLPRSGVACRQLEQGTYHYVQATP